MPRCSDRTISRWDQLSRSIPTRPTIRKIPLSPWMPTAISPSCGRGTRAETSIFTPRAISPTALANGSNFQVNPSTGQDQEDDSIAFAGSSNPIITWSSSGQDGSGWGVYAQQVTPTGTLLGSEVQVNTYTQGDQYYSSVAGAANGNVVIVWSSNGRGKRPRRIRPELHGRWVHRERQCHRWHIPCVRG